MSVARGDVVGGKYRIEESLGRGGMGEVFGARDTTLDRDVAVKLVAHDAGTRDPEVARARFVREAKAAAALKSRHAVRIHEVDVADGTPYLVMERLRGQDLAAVVRARGRLPADEAVEYVLQACEAIAEAHALGIVHRDLKPSNLFLTRSDDDTPLVKVLDFGISKDTASNAQITATDAVMGSPMYMSPEQVRSAKYVDARTDIWSLGVVLYELVTASAPFDAPSATALCVMIASDPHTPLRDKVPDAPEGLEQVVAKCLEKRAADRFDDLAAFARALAPFAPERARASVGRIERALVSSADTVRPEEVVAVATAPPAPATLEPRGSAGATRDPPPVQEAGMRQRLIVFLSLVACVGGVYVFFKRATVSTSVPPQAQTTGPATAAPRDAADASSLRVDEDRGNRALANGAAPPDAAALAARPSDAGPRVGPRIPAQPPAPETQRQTRVLHNAEERPDAAAPRGPQPYDATQSCSRAAGTLVWAGCVYDLLAARPTGVISPAEISALAQACAKLQEVRDPRAKRCFDRVQEHSAKAPLQLTQ